MKLLREVRDHHVLLTEVDAQLKKIQLQMVAVLEVADRLLDKKEPEK